MTISPRGSWCPWTALLRTGFALLLFGALPVSFAQQTPASAANSSSASEMEISDESATSVEDAAKFRVNVHLVLVRVIVRDTSGRAIGDLHKEDFELFDNGKKQTISEFDAERLTPVHSTSAAAQAIGNSASSAPAELSSRYVAYLFDDERLSFENLTRVREAAQRRADDLAPADRVAVYSTSGQITLDFTDDRAALRRALNHYDRNRCRGRTP